MPTSPYVKFKIKNENIEVSSPSNGINAVIVPTTKGPTDGSVLISSPAQFQRVFGEELSKQGISQVVTALQLGTKLRIARVVSQNETQLSKSFGDDTLKLGTNPDSDTDSFGFTLKSTGKITKGTYSHLELSIGLMPGTAERESGSSSIAYHPYMEIIGNDNDRLFQVNFLDPSSVSRALDPNNNLGFYLELSDSNLAKVKANNYEIVPNNGATIFVDGSDTYSYDLLQDLVAADSTYSIDTYKNALNNLLDYTDYYDLAFLDLDYTNFDPFTQLNTELQDIYNLQEFVVFQEIPYTTNTKEGILKAANKASQSPFLSLYAGGIKRYDKDGILQDGPVMGTVLGLQGRSAAEYGPWRSAAGLNRGIVENAYGPVCPNYGTPSHYDDLNDLANAGVNLFVIKDTRTAGKRTVLWHNFTRTVIQDSFKFLSNLHLVLYLKKQIRPIAESFIEEPNIWTSWKLMYYQVKDITDPLVNASAITDPQWLGDQDATKWDELQINNEADCRQGKYKAILKFKDVATMQEISITLNIERANNSVQLTIDA